MTYLRIKAEGSIQVFDTEVSTVLAEVDQIYRVQGRRSHLIHIEMQSHRSSALARRL
jgi:hypothetical protein